MLRDLTKKDWMTMLGIPETHVPCALLLWGTRNLKTRYSFMRAHFDDVLEIGSPNGLVEDVMIGRLGQAFVGYASVYGAPMSSEIVHLFGVLGARLVIQIGTCGGFSNGLQAGDLFAVEEAHCGEGASQYYRQGEERVRATTVFSDIPEDGWRGISVARGTIYTTSALFAEAKEVIDRWSLQGFSAVDMETAATFAVAEHFGMDRGSLLTVFDNPRGEDHILSADTEKNARRAAAQEVMVAVAIATIRSHARRIGEASAAGHARERD